MARVPIPDLGHPHVFVLTTPWHLLNKLAWEIRHLLDEDPWPQLAIPYRAFNCAVTAWHLADWTWEALSKEHQFHVARDRGQFKTELKAASNELFICAEIANGSKHSRRGNDQRVRADVEWTGAQDSASGYRITPVIYFDGQRMQAVDVFTMVRGFWHRKLAAFGLAEDIFVEGGAAGIADD